MTLTPEWIDPPTDPHAQATLELDQAAVALDGKSRAVALRTRDARIVTRVRTGPPSGCGLRSELVSACELVPGDRAVPVEEQVIGPEKDAFRHFRVIEGTGSLQDGQVLLTWGGVERVVAGDWPFARVATGRVVEVDEDGDRAHYEWEAAR